MIVRCDNCGAHRFDSVRICMACHTIRPTATSSPRTCSGEVRVQKGGIVCCGRLWVFPAARCELCGCTWGRGEVFLR